MNHFTEKKIEWNSVSGKAQPKTAATIISSCEEPPLITSDCTIITSDLQEDMMFERQQFIDNHVIPSQKSRERTAPQKKQNATTAHAKIPQIFPQEFVRSFFKIKEYHVEPNGMIYSDINKPVNGTLDELKDHYYHQPQHVTKGLPVSSLECALEQIKKAEKKAAWEKMRCNIGIYTPDLGENLNQFCCAIQGYPKGHIFTGADAVTFENIRFVLEHFIRQCKLKMNGNGLDVFAHMMIIFVGAQNAGKSTAVRKLLSPLGHCYTEPGLHEVTDTQKNYPLFGDNNALLCEELAGAGRAEVETLKHVITSRLIQVRRYHSQERVEVYNAATLIGTSNKPIWEVIRDTTGLRRFFDITVADKMHFETINSIDYVAMWQGVKHELNAEERKKFDLKYKADIAPIQQNARIVDSVEEFVSEMELVPGDYRIGLSQLYRRYKEMCDLYGKRYADNNIFRMKLKQMQLQEGGRVAQDRTTFLIDGSKCHTCLKTDNYRRPLTDFDF